MDVVYRESLYLQIGNIQSWIRSSAEEKRRASINIIDVSEIRRHTRQQRGKEGDNILKDATQGS